LGTRRKRGKRRRRAAINSARGGKSIASLPRRGMSKGLLHQKDQKGEGEG